MHLDRHGNWLADHYAQRMILSYGSAFGPNMCGTIGRYRYRYRYHPCRSGSICAKFE